MIKNSTLVCLILALSIGINAQNWRTGSGAKADKLQFSKQKTGGLEKVQPVNIQLSDANTVKYTQKSNLLKASKLAQVTPKALFKRPTGTYLPSIIGNEDPQYLGYTYTFAGVYGSAFSTPWVFTNKSTNATGYRWKWGTTVNFSNATDVTLKDDVDNFMFAGDYYPPELTAGNGVDSATYKLPAGDNFSDAFLLSSSGIMYMGNMDYYGNSSTVNNGVSVGFYTASGGVGLSGSGSGYFWGTCLRNQDGTNGTKVNSIVSVYEKPMSTLTIKDICYFGGSTVATPIPASKKLTATIVKINASGEITNDTIAYSEITGADAIVESFTGGYGVYLPFKFTEVDVATGREATVYPEISDAYAIILSGLEQDGMNFGLYSDVANTLESTSYFTKIDAVTSAPIDGLYHSSTTGMNIALTLNAYYNYLYIDPASKTLTAPAAGGEAIDDVLKQSGAFVYSFFYDVNDSVTNEDLIWLKEELPDWLSLTYTDQYYADYGGLLFVFTATALPNGVIGRQADVTLSSFGAETTITIKQGNVTGVTNPKQTNVEANKKNNAFELKYSSDFNNINLISTSGQLIQSVNLPSSGTYLLDTSKLKQGIYFLQFNGSSSKTIKILN